MSSIQKPELLTRSESGTIRPVMAVSDSDLKQISSRLELLRTALDVSQVAMAARIGNGLTPQKWNNYERGRDRIPVEVAIRLCIVSGATLDYIYRGVIGGVALELTNKLQAVTPQKRARRA